MKNFRTPIKYAFLLAFFIESFYCSLTKAQLPSLSFNHITSEEGAPENGVLDTYQDQYGFMWFASINGLYKYDGRRFVNYFETIRDSLSKNTFEIIPSIVEDSYNGFWVCYDTNGLVLMNRYTEKCFRFKNDPENPASLSNNHTRCVYEDSKKNMWIATM